MSAPSLAATPAVRLTARMLGHPAVIGAGALVMAGAAWLLPDPLRAVLVVPLALLLPGHALLCAAVGYEGVGELPLRVALTVLLSLAIYPLLALAVHKTGLGDLTRTSVVVSVGAVSVVAALVGRLRFPPTEGWPSSPPLPDGLRAAGQGTALAGVAALSLALAVWALPDRTPQRFVALGFDGTTAQVRGPVATPRGGPATVAVRIRNHDGADRQFVLRAWVDGGPTWPAVRLRVRDSEEWRGRLRGPVLPSGCLQRLRIRLEPVDGPSVRVRPLKLYFAATDGLPCLYPAPFATGRP
jgi:hypothetical protein